SSSAQGRLVFDGTYALSGTNPDGSKYNGTLTITPYGDGYRLTQVVGSDTYRGIANDIGDYLAGAYVYNNGVPSVSLYRVSAANTLSGYWQDYNNQKEGTEEAVLASRSFAFVPSAPVANTWDYAGTYGIRGTDPDGDTYTGTMILSSYGDGYRASFSSGGNTWRGIANYIGNNLAIAWNSGGVASVNIYTGNPRTGDLSGFWQDYNSQKEGTETATLR
ncbi:MAG: hypothetical protein ACK41E_10610, partial [Deinococcales bacterium]